MNLKNLPIFFVAGLPRSGSTLLMNLLGQNPQNHVTPTNGLIDLIIRIRNTWAQNDTFKSQGLWKVVQPRIHAGCVDKLKPKLVSFDTYKKSA